MSTTRTLSIALAVQAVAVLVAWWPTDPDAADGRPVFDLTRDAIVRVEVAVRPSGSEAEAPVVLAREGEGWVVRSAGDFPATEARVEELLDRLLALRSQGVVATREASHGSFEIGDESYGRRISVTGNGEPQVWLVSPATSRSVYLRRPGEAEVQRATGASEWSFHDRASHYWDDRYVEEDPERIDALALRNAHGELRFERVEGSWTLDGLAQGERADADAIADLVAALVRVRMREPVGRELDPAYGLDAGDRVDWTVRAADQSIRGGYAVGAAVDGEVHLKAVDHPFVVRVASSAVARLRDAKRTDFVETGPDPDAAP